MNPLLPESANTLGRNVSHGVKPAKPGAKVDSDSTRFQDTLQANIPGRQKTAAAKNSGDSNAPAKGGTPDNASATQTAAQTAVQSPKKQSASESGPPQNTQSSLDSETGTDSNPHAVDGQLVVLETAAMNVGNPLAEGGSPVLAAAGENAGKTATTASLLKAGQATEIPAGVAQSVSGVASAITTSTSQAALQASTQASPVTPAALNTPGSAAPVTIPDTGLAAETPAGALAGTGVVRLANSDTGGVPGKLSPHTTPVELEKPFASLEADLSLTDAGGDKKNLMAKPAGAAVNPGIPLSPQPAYIKSNLDWQFANRLPTLEADAALDIPSVSKGSSSVTGTAYSAVSAVAAMQVNEAVADHRVQMPVNIKFGQPEWAGMVAERTAMMAAQKISFAELQLDPPELGPLQVKVTVQNDQASINFVSANPAVRDSLEQTAVRLREMLDQQGLDLVDVNVADQSDRQQQNPDDSHPNSRRTLNAEDDIPSGGSVNLMTVVASGIDHYV